MFCDYNVSKNLFVKRSKLDKIKRHKINFREKNNDKLKNVNFFYSNAKTKKTKKNLSESNMNKNNNVVCNKEKFTRIIQKKFYRYQLQINYLIYCFFFYMFLNLHTMLF